MMLLTLGMLRLMTLIAVLLPYVLLIASLLTGMELLALMLLPVGLLAVTRVVAPVGLGELLWHLCLATSQINVDSSGIMFSGVL